MTSAWAAAPACATAPWKPSTPCRRRSRCCRWSGSGRSWGHRRRQGVDGFHGAVAHAGAAAQALVIVVGDGAIHGDVRRDLYRAVRRVLHEAAQGAAELPAPAFGRGVQQLVHVKGLAALAGAGWAVGGALAAADAELFVTHDLAAHAGGAVQHSAGYALEDLAAAIGKRHQAAPIAPAASALPA